MQEEKKIGKKCEKYKKKNEKEPIERKTSTGKAKINWKKKNIERVS